MPAARERSVKTRTWDGFQAMSRHNNEHDPEKCAAVFPRDKRVAFARRSSLIRSLERDPIALQDHCAAAPAALNKANSTVIADDYKVLPSRGSAEHKRDLPGDR